MKTEPYIKITDGRISLDEEPFKSLTVSGDLQKSKNGIYFATERGAKIIAGELDRRYGLTVLRGEEEEY